MILLMLTQTKKMMTAANTFIFPDGITSLKIIYVIFGVSIPISVMTNIMIITDTRAVKGTQDDINFIKSIMPSFFIGNGL